jgi:hypothetical protein
LWFHWYIRRIGQGASAMSWSGLSMEAQQAIPMMIAIKPSVPPERADQQS